MILRCVTGNNESTLTTATVEERLSNDAEFWSLLQPHRHLNAGRISNGCLAVPKWPSTFSIYSGQDSGRGSSLINEPILLTTCVSSKRELEEIIHYLEPTTRFTKRALDHLYYFMKCSQLNESESDSVSKLF